MARVASLSLIALLALTGCAGDRDSAASGSQRPASSEPGGAPAPARAERSAQRRDRGVRLVRVGAFEAPVYATAPEGDRRLFVVERGGTVRIVRDGRVLRRPFLDVSSATTTDGERGLLSLAFPRDYERSGRFYFYFTDRQGTLRVHEGRRSGASADRAEPGLGRTVITQPHAQYSNHNGGQIQFGPDGLLYLGPGDGGGGGDPTRSGQNLDTLLGKLVRIDPRAADGRPYRVPRDNPFVARPGARPEVYAYGLRNPFRFSFDRRTGDLTVADQGQDLYEEVNLAPRGSARGANFGWNVFEGRHRFRAGGAPGHRAPALERAHDDGYCSITGGYVVRDHSLGRLYGRYLYSDLCATGLRSVRLRGTRASADRALGIDVPGIVSFGEDGRGRVHAVSIEGPVLRLAPR